MTFPTYRTMSITLDANEQFSPNISGAFITIISATADFQMGFDGEQLIDTGRGFSYPGGIDPQTGERQRFSRITLKETKGASNTIVIGWGDGEIIDNRAIFGGEAVPTEEVPGDVFASSANVSAADGAATAILAADANRLTGILTNLGTGTVYVTDSAATGAEGVPLQAGQTREFNTSAALYVRNDTGGAISIARAEVKRS